MMDTEEKTPPTTQRPKEPGLRILAYFLFYLCLNFGWTLWFYPGGDDGLWAFLRLGSPENIRMLHLFLMYGCMLAVYVFVRAAVGGPWWLGSLAAVLTMANPLKTEAMISLEGTRMVLAAFLALATLALYASDTKNPSPWKAVAFLLCALASMTFRGNAMLILVLMAYHFCVQKNLRVHRSSWIGVIGLLTWLLMAYPDLRSFQSWNPVEMLGPLCLVPYPIGLLPETVVWFHHHAWTGWACAGLALLTLAAFSRFLRQPAFFFGLLGALLFRLGQGRMIVDWVHMTGGGNLIVPIALLTTAFVAVCGRIILHPKWLKPMVSMTTLLCLLFFGLQVRANLAWREAGSMNLHFLIDLTRTASEDTVGILPDFQHYAGATIGFAQTAQGIKRWEEKTLPLLSMNYDPKVRVHVESWSPEVGKVRVEGMTLSEAMPATGLLEKVGDKATMDSVELELLVLDDAGYTVAIRPRPWIPKLPTVLVPGEWPSQSKKHP